MGIFRKFASRVPFLVDLLEAIVEMDRLRVERDALQSERGALQAELQSARRTIASLESLWDPWDRRYVSSSDSVDSTPWDHPFLTPANIARFREFSERVWEIALRHAAVAPRPLDVAFAVNMAQNMHKWARLAQEAGAKSTLYLHPQDQCVLSVPQWEEFDGEYADLMAGAQFLEAHSDLPLAVETKTIPMDDMGLLAAFRAFQRGDRKPLLQLLAGFPTLRHESALSYQGVYPYVAWARELAGHDVSFTASSCIPSYLSGRPYVAQMVGGDLWYDCGRGTTYGEVMALSFNAARFLTVTNPHCIAMCRRLGFRNAIYLPYPMDDSRYTPGPGGARVDWESRFGPGIYVLSSARIDAAVKGNGIGILDALEGAVRQRPQLRVILLAWGADVDRVKEEVQRRGLQSQLIFLKPVGKRRLIDYYRSCDIVLDQLHLGYYGASALEAASVGKPVVMYIRKEHYAGLYRGDVAPMQTVHDPGEMAGAIIKLADSAAYREEAGRALREWLVRTHGAARTVPLMLGLLRMAADGIALPADLISPLADPESDEEREYNARCLTAVR